MSSSIRPRARLHSDREGDPLDGLVNLFDLGVVLAVAFLLAALASLDLTGVLTRGDVTVVRSGPDGADDHHQARREAAAAASCGPASGSPAKGSASGRSTGSPTGGSSTPRAADVEFLWDGLRQAFDLLLSGDDEVLDIVWVTLRMAFWSTLLALALGLPLGLAARARPLPWPRRRRSRSSTPAWACRPSSSGSSSRCCCSAARRSAGSTCSTRSTA